MGAHAHAEVFPSAQAFVTNCGLCQIDADGLLVSFRVMGRLYPPEDIWREPDLSASSKAKNKVSSVSKKKGPKKADSARRLKVTSF